MLDSRLSAVAGLVRHGKKFADIGTDHAYLPVYLIENGIIDRAIASDLRQGPLNNAASTVGEHGLQDKILLRLSDGLDGFCDGEADEIAVAGMGGLLISEFIRRTAWLKNPDIHLILQPMTHAEDLRKTLFDCGFYIDCERAAQDGDKLYIIISAYYSGRIVEYRETDLITGRLPRNGDIASLAYLNKLYQIYSKKLSALKKAGKQAHKLESVVKELSKWQQ